MAAEIAVAAVYVLDVPGEVPVYASHPSSASFQLLVRDETPAVVDSPSARALSTSAQRRPPHVAALVEKISLRQRVDPALVHAVIEVESRYRADAISLKGAVGVMQLMPATAHRYGVKDRRDPLQNIEGGVAYLKDLLARFQGNIALALAAYNAGEHAVERHSRSIPRYRETMLYVPQVLDAYARHRGAPALPDR